MNDLINFGLGILFIFYGFYWIYLAVDENEEETRQGYYLNKKLWGSFWCFLLGVLFLLDKCMFGGSRSGCKS